MDWIAERSPRPWRLNLRMATFRDAPFHIEVGGKNSGRRIALHEYPKRDLPYAEDMGRRAIMFDLSGYIIEADRRLGQDYRRPRDRLIIALEKEGSGPLVHPTLGQLTVVCERYSVIESRERGGYCVFEMRFIEAGQQANEALPSNSQEQVKNAANETQKQSSAAYKSTLDQYLNPDKSIFAPNLNFLNQ